MTVSGSVTPWNAPAIKGLSSGGLQKTTSLAHPIESLSLVSSAVSRIMSPMILTASMLMPVRVEPTETEPQTLSVDDRASGIERMSSLSASVMPFCTRAE